MLDDFLVRAALGGVGVAVAAAPLGCFVVWRRMAYFGDATAHAAILGVALALALQISVLVGVAIIALLMATLVNQMARAGQGTDTLLGVLSHAGLAFGLVAVSFLQNVRVDLHAYLFGDILTVTRWDLALIWGGTLVVCGLMWWRWSSLLTATLHPELAMASGINPRREHLVMTLALALVVAVAIKIVGALLITALLIIPAASARGLVWSPERMVLGAAVLGSLAILGGLCAALIIDTPAGPSIVSVAAIGFALTSVLRTALRRP